MARHSTPGLSMNTYGRTRDNRLASLAEYVGGIVNPDNCATSVQRVAAGAESANVKVCDSMALDVIDNNVPGRIRNPNDENEQSSKSPYEKADSPYVNDEKTKAENQCSESVLKDKSESFEPKSVLQACYGLSPNTLDTVCDEINRALLLAKVDKVLTPTA